MHKAEQPFLIPQQVLKTHYALIKKHLSPIISHKNVMHLDIPCHSNIGDLLIDLGTEKFINDCNATCLERYSAFDINRLKNKQAASSTVLLLHGGGNFGDLYPIHQQLRLDIINQYPDNPIIILPQSVHYQDISALINDAKFINRHQKLTVCLRDQPSYDLINAHVDADKLLLLPDMASSLVESFPYQPNAMLDRLLFRRNDIESTQASTPTSSFDWSNLVSKLDNRKLKLAKRLLKNNHKLLHRYYGHKLHINLRNKLIHLAVNHFQQHQTIDTDRLHGMILSQLLQIPTVMHDNSYGKNRRYFDAWFSES
ncbi:MAG: polysaccharide pyruvyl transferase family protein [Pseudomonadales bacterium]|nr:polysaccharide pyruvyl transferase family protein [Pseudomonadales bacterium]